jgi:hypothetical protein
MGISIASNGGCAQRRCGPRAEAQPLGPRAKAPGEARRRQTSHKNGISASA